MIKAYDWSQVVDGLRERHPYLEGSFVSIDDVVFKELKDVSYDQTLHDPLHVEFLLDDIGIILDRCVIYRKEAHELALAGVKAELDYETYATLSEIEDALDLRSFRASQSQQEMEGFGRAANSFEGVKPPYNDFAHGFKEQSLAIVNSASETMGADLARAELVARKRKVLDDVAAKMHSRHVAPGSAHNFVDRWKRIVRLLRQDIREAYEKIRCAEKGIKQLFGDIVPASLSDINISPLPLPWPSAENKVHSDCGFLDLLVLWTRSAVRSLAHLKEKEVEIDLVIPLTSTFRGTRTESVPPLFDIADFNEQVVNGGGVFRFYLRPLSQINNDLKNMDPLNWSRLRLRSIGLAFSHRWWQDGADSATDPASQAKSARRRQMERLMTCSAWVWPPDRVPPHPMFPPSPSPEKPPIQLGQVKNYELESAVVMESGLTLINVDPLGPWQIELSPWMLQTGLPRDVVPSGADGSWSNRRLIHEWHTFSPDRVSDLKLHLRVAALPRGH